jgi:hypothetical protein
LPIAVTVHGSEVHKFGVQEFEPLIIRELYVALDQQYISNAEFKDVYYLAGRTRAAIRGFIKYLIGYEQSKRKKGNLEQ